MLRSDHRFRLAAVASDVYVFQGVPLPSGQGATAFVVVLTCLVALPSPPHLIQEAPKRDSQAI